VVEPERVLGEVLAEHAPTLLRIDGVEGVGEGLCDGRPCLRVYLRSADVAVFLPRELGGYPVSTVVTGVVRTTDDADLG
jgi:hypothetical protein